MAGSRLRAWSLPSTLCTRIKEAQLASWDVAIVGGGPAGSAAALTFRDCYPMLSVGLLEASRFDEPRVGEVLSAAAVPVLAHLGLADALQHECARLVHASAVSWGRDALVESPHLFSLHGPSWHLDRTRFDALLAEQAERRGVVVRRGCRVANSEKAGGGWLLHFASGETATSRFTIDASGRSATIARAAGARIVSTDHLIGFVCFFEPREYEDPRTLIESVHYGWWYTGALKNGVRMAACMTDADIGRDLNLADRRSWLDRLLETAHVAGAVGKDPDAMRGPVVRSAASQYLSNVCGADWIAAGDAAMALDPLSGQGILVALRSGIFAAYAAGDWIKNGDDSGLSRYPHFIGCTSDNYLRSRRRYYSEERRWPDRAFWRRRGDASE